VLCLDCPMKMNLITESKYALMLLLRSLCPRLVHAFVAQTLTSLRPACVQLSIVVTLRAFFPLAYRRRERGFSCYCCSRIAVDLFEHKCAVSMRQLFLLAVLVLSALCGLAAQALPPVDSAGKVGTPNNTREAHQSCHPRLRSNCC
jgi:hypothetical protein